MYTIHYTNKNNEGHARGYANSREEMMELVDYITNTLGYVVTKVAVEEN